MHTHPAPRRASRLTPPPPPFADRDLLALVAYEEPCQAPEPDHSYIHGARPLDPAPSAPPATAKAAAAWQPAAAAGAGPALGGGGGGALLALLAPACGALGAASGCWGCLRPVAQALRPPLLLPGEPQRALLLPGLASGARGCLGRWGRSARAAASVLLLLHHLAIGALAAGLRRAGVCRDKSSVGYWATAAGLGALASLWRFSWAPAPLLLPAWSLAAALGMQHAGCGSCCNTLAFKAGALLASGYSAAAGLQGTRLGARALAQLALPPPVALLRPLAVLAVLQAWVSTRHVGRQRQGGGGARHWRRQQRSGGGGGGTAEPADPARVAQVDALMGLALMACFCSWGSVLLAALLLQKLQLVHLSWRAALGARSIVSKYTHDEQPAFAAGSSRASRSLLGKRSAHEAAAAAHPARGVGAWQAEQAAAAAQQQEHQQLQLQPPQHNQPVAFCSARDWLQRLCLHGWIVVLLAAVLYQPPFALAADCMLPSRVLPAVQGGFVVLCWGLAASAAVWALLGGTTIEGMHHHLLAYLWEEKHNWLPCLAAAAAHFGLAAAVGHGGEQAAAGCLAGGAPAASLAAQHALLLALCALDLLGLAAAEAQFAWCWLRGH